MTPTFVVELFTTWKISVGAQKINGLPLETYSMALARFLLHDSLGKVRFFEETFLLTHTNIKVVLEMPFYPLAMQTSSLQSYKNSPEGCTL